MKSPLTIFSIVLLPKKAQHCIVTTTKTFRSAELLVGLIQYMNLYLSWEGKKTHKKIKSLSNSVHCPFIENNWKTRKVHTALCTIGEHYVEGGFLGGFLLITLYIIIWNLTIYSVLHPKPKVIISFFFFYHKRDILGNRIIYTGTNGFSTIGSDVKH